MLDLESAIKHAEDVADKQNEIAFELNTTYNAVTEYSKECSKCAEDHSLLAEWLKELKQLREQTRWIPVSERLPEDKQEILFSTKTGRVHSGKYHDDDSANQWYSHRDKCRAWNNVVNAWMPLPLCYEPKESEDKE